MPKIRFMIASLSLHSNSQMQIELTQLLVALANIIAHDGSFDNRRPSGGNLILFLGEPVFPAWITLSSDLLMKLLSRGSSVTR